MGDDQLATADHAVPDYTRLDDSTLIARRREVREQLEEEPPNMADLVRAHHLMTNEVLRRTIALRKQPT